MTAHQNPRKASFAIHRHSVGTQVNHVSIECWDAEGFTRGSVEFPLEHAEALGLALIRFCAFHNPPTMADGSKARGQAIDSVEFLIE